MADAGVETETDSRADENDREEEETKEDNSSKPSEFVEDEVSHEQDGAVDEESVDDENQENKEERKNNITQFEMGFLKECTKIVTHMTVKDAHTMFDNSNPKSWLWWPKRGAGSSAETFYARAVGTWYPSKMFHEMQGRIFCPYCDHAISHETGRWVPLKEAREIITFDSTWLLIGREYTCRNKGCGKTIRNTTAEFLKQCPENTRHRFPITMRKKLAIETPFAHMLKEVWLHCGQQALDLTLGAHVRRFEELREAYYLSHIQATNPNNARKLVTIPSEQTIPGMFASIQENNLDNIIVPSEEQRRCEDDALRLLNWEVNKLGLPPKKLAKLLTVKVKNRPIRVIEVMRWTQTYVANLSKEWILTNVKGLCDNSEKTKAAPKLGRYRKAMVALYAKAKLKWDAETNLEVNEVYELVYQKQSRERENARRRAQSEKINSMESAQSEIEEEKSSIPAPAPFGDFDDPEGYNGMQLGRYFLDDVCLELCSESSRPAMQELISLPAKRIRVDCTFRFPSRVQVKVRNSENNMRIYNPYEGLLTITNESNDIVWYKGLREGEELVGEMTRALREFNEVRKRMSEDGSYAPEVIYVDNCCQVRKALQNIWNNVPVKLDFLHWLQRFNKILNFAPSHPLRKQFMTCMTAAVLCHEEEFKEVLKNKLGAGEKMKRKWRNEYTTALKKIPEENILKARVMTVIYAFLEVDQQRKWTDMHEKFAEACGEPLGTNKSELEKLMKELFKTTELGDSNCMNSKCPRSEKLFRNHVRDNPNTTWNKFIQSMLSHITNGCLSDMPEEADQILRMDGNYRINCKTGANLRFHRILNELIGNRVIGVVRADVMLLYAALKANRQRAAELCPMHKHMPCVDIHSSKHHRLRINNLVNQHFPGGVLPFRDDGLPAALHPGICIGLSLLPFVGSFNQGPEKDGNHVTSCSSSVEIAHVTDCREGFTPLLVEQVWAVLVAIALSAQKGLLIALRYLISRLLKETEHQNEIKQNLETFHLSSSFGGFIAVKIMHAARKAGYSNSRDFNLDDVVQYLADNLGNDQGKEVMKVEILSSSHSGGLLNVSTVEKSSSTNTAGGQAKTYAITIGHVIAPTRSFNTSRFPAAQAADSHQRNLTPALAAALNRFTENVQLDASYGVSCRPASRPAWFAFKSSPLKLLNKKSCRVVSNEKQAKPLEDNDVASSAVVGSATDHHETSQKRSRVTSNQVSGSTVPFAKGQTDELSPEENAERRLFEKLLHAYKLKLNVQSSSQVVFEVFAHLWNELAGQPSMLQAIDTDIAKHGIKGKSVRDLRTMANVFYKQKKVSYEAKQSLHKGEDNILSAEARKQIVKLGIKTLSQIQQASATAKVEDLYNQFQSAEDDSYGGFVFDLLGASRHLGQYDARQPACNFAPHEFIREPVKVDHKIRPMGYIGIFEDSVSTIVAKPRHEYRSTQNLNPRYFCCMCSCRKDSSDEHRHGMECTAAVKSVWSPHQLLQFPRHFFKEYPSYLLPVAGKLTPNELHLHKSYRDILSKLKRVVCPKTALSLRMAEVSTALCNVEPLDIHIDLLIDHARPSGRVSNFVMDLYIRVLRHRQSKNRSLPQTVFFTHGFNDDFDASIWLSGLRSYFKSKNHAAHFNKRFSKDLYIPECAKFVVFPLLRSNHWTLLVLDIELKKIYCYDPDSRNKDSNFHPSLNIIEKIVTTLSIVLKDGEWTQSLIYGHQQNSYDCGIYVMAMVEGISRGAKIQNLLQEIRPAHGLGSDCDDLRHFRDAQMVTFADILQDSIDFSAASGAETRSDIIRSFLVPVPFDYNGGKKQAQKRSTTATVT